MGKRKWTNMQQLDAVIIEMRNQRMSRRQIAEELGLNEKQIDNWVTRHNKKMAAIAAGQIAKHKGRPRTRPLTTPKEYEKEIARLEMENKLLRDFLQSVGRR